MLLFAAVEVVHWEGRVPDVPECSVSAIVAGGKQAVVKLVVVDVFDLPLVEGELTDGVQFLIAFSPVLDVPHRQLAIEAPSHHHVLLVGVPLDRVALSLVAGQHQAGGHFHPPSLEPRLVEDMDISEWCACCNQVTEFGVPFDPIDLALMLDFVLDDHSVLHGVVIFAD